MEKRKESKETQRDKEVLLQQEKSQAIIKLEQDNLKGKVTIQDLVKFITNYL